MSSRSTQKPPTRDRRYFLPSVVFQVENKLFQVPKVAFEKNSEVFSTVFQLPLGPGLEEEGSSEDNPIVLEGISKEDFKGFLCVLYPLSFPYNYDDVPIRAWISALRLSTMWDFTSVRKLAIKVLENSNEIDDISRMLLGVRYNVRRFFRMGFSRLTLRENGPTDDEALRLGQDITDKIWQLRVERTKIVLSKEFTADHPFDLDSEINGIFHRYFAA